MSTQALAHQRPGMALYAVSVLSLLAAVIHLWVTPEHFEEWWGYGIFFLAAAVAQGLYAPIMLWRPGRTLLLAGLAGNLAIVILWLATRTTGIPLFGPHAGEIEEAGVLDFACTLAEVGIVILSGMVAMKGLQTQRRIQIVVVLGVFALFYWHLLHLLGGYSAH